MLCGGSFVLVGVSVNCVLPGAVPIVKLIWPATLLSCVPPVVRKSMLPVAEPCHLATHVSPSYLQPAVTITGSIGCVKNKKLKLVTSEGSGFESSPVAV